MTSSEIALLKTELDNNPKGLDYSGTDQEVADIKNTSGLSNEKIDRVNVSKEEAMENVDPDEFLLLSQAERDLWLALMALDEVPIGNSSIRDQIDTIWVGSTITKANMIALRQKDATRAEMVLGIGKKPLLIDVHKARRI